MNFKDEIYVDGKKIIEIPIENIFYEQQEVQVKSKFSDPPRKRKIKKNNQDVKFTPDGINKGDLVFNPLKAITYEKQQQLAIEYNKKYPQKEEKIQKNTKWGEEWEKTFNPPLLDNINHELTLQEIEYLLRLYRLDDLNRKQKDNILEIPDEDIRSPEPEFLYNKQGKRINTLNQRIANEMYLEKNQLIEDCIKMDFNFMVPFDWKEKKKARKIFIPEFENTTIDFTQILLGPGGRTQRVLEQLSNCRIQIRGKNFGTKAQRRQNEQTHVLVQADNEEDLENGVQMVQRVLKGDTLQDIASSQNKFLKTGYELIAIETVLRDFCENCKEEGHKIWNCPYMTMKNVKKGIDLNGLVKCELCGGKSHVKKDCPKYKYLQENDDMDIHYEHYNLLKDEQLQDPEILEIENEEAQKTLTNFITDVKEQPQKMLKDKENTTKADCPEIEYIGTPAHALNSYIDFLGQMMDLNNQKENFRLKDYRETSDSPIKKLIFEFEMENQKKKYLGIEMVHISKQNIVHKFVQSNDEDDIKRYLGIYDEPKQVFQCDNLKQQFWDQFKKSQFQEIWHDQQSNDFIDFDIDKFNISRKKFDNDISTRKKHHSNKAQSSSHNIHNVLHGKLQNSVFKNQNIHQYKSDYLNNSHNLLTKSYFDNIGHRNAHSHQNRNALLNAFARHKSQQNNSILSAINNKEQENEKNLEENDQNIKQIENEPDQNDNDDSAQTDISYWVNQQKIQNKSQQNPNISQDKLYQHKHKDHNQTSNQYTNHHKKNKQHIQIRRTQYYDQQNLNLIQNLTRQQLSDLTNSIYDQDIIQQNQFNIQTLDHQWKYYLHNKILGNVLRQYIVLLLNKSNS